VTPGLILLLFLGLMCAMFISRARRRMGMATGGKIWLTVIVGFALIVLVAWVAQQ
jgi:hypothetical protein